MARGPIPWAPLTPPRPRKPFVVRSELRPDGDGTRRADDLTFTAKVARDGRVTIEDKPNLQAHLALPSAKDVGRHLERWYADPYGNAEIDERSTETATVPLAGGQFDLTDWAMRSAGMDPYYRRKQLFYDRTRDERAGMAVTEAAENLRDSIADLPGYLAKIWRHTAWTPAQRRRALFELWDECAETGSPQVVRAGRRARATIVAFIRRRLPAGSADAFPPAELAALNRERQSRVAFAPYDAPESGADAP